MTAYQGGKGRLGKKISIIIKMIENDLDITTRTYVEPFCGMCGVMFHVSMLDKDRKIIANDANGDVIKMWTELQNGWDPPESCSREEFNELKNNHRQIPNAKRGFLGSVSSYGNIFMGYYRLHLSHRNYVGEGRKRILKISKFLENVEFTHGSYENVPINDSIVYCDPPYINNGFKTRYFQGFDHDHFWNIMRTWSLKEIVIISERTSPDDFKCIWKVNKHFSINKQTLTKSTECLFIHESIYNKISCETLDDIKIL